MVLDIEKIHLLYEDTLDIKIDDKTCDCINNRFLPDNDNYYLVCNKCGIVKDTLDEYVINYTDKQNLCYVPKRYYKRSAYLRSKINSILKNKKPVLPDIHINKIKKKLKKINITTISKYMKKNKLRDYDPIKTIFLIKGIRQLNMCSIDFNRLISDFNKKEKVYRNNNYKRFNYNFVLFKIFEEWNRPDLCLCLKALQDDNIIKKHNDIYDRLFN